MPIAVVWLTTPRGYAPAKAAVMYNPRGEQDFSSHAFDLLRLPPEEIRRQRGHFAAHELAQARWTRLLFD